MRFISALCVALLGVLVPCPTLAATVTHAVTTPDTGASPNTSGAFTPAADDLLVVFVDASATVTSGSALTSSAGLVFSKIRSETFMSSAILELWVANSLAAASSQTVSWENTSDQSTGTNISVYRVAGMSRTGSAAVRQTGGQSGQSGGNTPLASFPDSCLTANPTLGAVGNGSNPAGLTPPTDWTEGSDTAYTTPTTGIETVFRDSGFTATNMLWESTSATGFGDIIVELDTTSPPAAAASWRALIGVGL